MRKLLTLCLVRQDDKILLGMKKRGFGQGRWNGFGGKVESGEEIEAAARRELREEAGIDVRQLESIGRLEFEFQGNPEIMEVHVFQGTDFSGTPTESEEMEPRWFNLSEIPFAQMWPDDEYWFPLFLAGKKFQGRFLFDETDQILTQELAEIGEI